MTEEKRITLRPNSLCDHCRSKLIHKSKFKKTDPWMALEMMATIVLVKKVMDQKNYHIKYGQEVEGINSIICHGCFNPDLFNKIIDVAKTKDLEKVKALGE